jgi:hypothetical protein
VHPLTWGAGARCNRRDIHDRSTSAVPTRGHSLHGFARAEHRSDNIYCEDSGESLAGYLFQTRAPAGDGGIIYQASNRTEFSLSSLEQAHNILFARNVGLNSEGASASRKDLVRDSLRFRRSRAVVDCNCPSALARKTGYCRANPAARACDDERTQFFLLVWSLYQGFLRPPKWTIRPKAGVADD